MASPDSIWPYLAIFALFIGELVSAGAFPGDKFLAINVTSITLDKSIARIGIP